LFRLDELIGVVPDGGCEIEAGALLLNVWGLRHGELLDGIVI
jgi:hypothetical protein